MGSSKKHRGEKEASGTTTAASTGGATEQPPRHREHKKHKHRSGGGGSSGGERRKRSRERGSERGGGRRGAEAEARSGAHGRERSQAEPSERRVKREKRDDGYEAAASSKPSSGDASSLSIEETNKLRAKLGLKPLEVNAVKKEAGTKEEPVAAEVINPMALRQREELREKLAAAKEKRLLNQKLGKIKTLGEDDPWLDDTAAWIERSRQLQKEKDLAEKRAKLLEEMDQEFGVSTLVEEEFGQRRQDLYSARDLQGLTVEHAIDSFREGETLILTLKDKGVLQEEEDVLVNVNLLDKERAEKNVELRKKKPDYLPYAEDESVDDLAQQKPRSILSKYDEELEGERPHSFRLEQGGSADGLRERELEEIRARLRLQAQSLSTVGPRLASEYLTPEEMVTFKKTKRRVKKIRKKEKEVVVRADDLLPLGDQTQDGDFGSRLRGRGRRRVPEADEEAPEEEEKAPAPQPPQSDDTRVENMDISDDEEAGAPGSGSPEVLEEDEAELELQKQLEKGRRLRQLQQLRDSGEKLLPPPGGGDCEEAGVPPAGLGGGRGSGAEGGHRVQCHVGVLPHLGRDPHLRAGGQPGGAGGAHGLRAGRGALRQRGLGVGRGGEHRLEHRQPGRGEAAAGFLCLVHHHPGRGAHREQRAGGRPAAVSEQRAVGDHSAEGGPCKGTQQVPAVGRVLHRGQDGY
ncbi:U4/U6.U5 tri-snRNP-associated protein 1 isoform X2 [Meles meles]|uniref:U4/U6.U5 tri-snRNP-associated protein 1 isoform X2 n=1 Tax=Meles meles TaxID=9662 RepID=UPI001E69A440|nr:U4/U6.U5 tri-snRNP-associated protein 1 isoform X2 [Meles meles]